MQEFPPSTFASSSINLAMLQISNYLVSLSENFVSEVNKSVQIILIRIKTVPQAEAKWERKTIKNSLYRFNPLTEHLYNINI